MTTVPTRVWCFELYYYNERILVSKQVLASDNVLHIAATMCKTVFGLSDDICANDPRFLYWVTCPRARWSLMLKWNAPLDIYVKDPPYLLGCSFSGEYPPPRALYCWLNSLVVHNSVAYMQEFTFWLALEVNQLLEIVCGCTCISTKPT
jgi:hypothetical protein